MPICNGIASISTMTYTRTWDCRWAAGWSKVPVNGLFNNGSRESGCAGVRMGSTISYTSGSPGSTDALRPCSAWPCPRTRKYARYGGYIYEGRELSKLIFTYGLDTYSLKGCYS